MSTSSKLFGQFSPNGNSQIYYVHFLDVRTSRVTLAENGCLMSFYGHFFHSGDTHFIYSLTL